MVLLLAGGKPWVKFKRSFEKKPISGFYAWVAHLRNRNRKAVVGQFPVSALSGM